MRATERGPPAKVLSATSQTASADVLTLKASPALAPVPKQMAVIVLFSGYDGLLSGGCYAKDKGKGGKGGGGKKCVTAGANSATSPGKRLLT